MLICGMWYQVTRMIALSCPSQVSYMCTYVTCKVQMGTSNADTHYSLDHHLADILLNKMVETSKQMSRISLKYKENSVPSILTSMQ